MDVNRFLKTVIFLFVGGVSQLWGQADIAELTLSGPNFGYQTVGLYNLTGPADGCGGEYNVCNLVNISSWSLELFYLDNLNSTSSSITFNSNGAGDIVGPVDLVNNPDGYTGENANPWSLPFTLTNAGCSPTCDFSITQIVFSGTVDQSTLQLFNNGGPTTPLFLSSQAFSATWNVPSTDYTSPDGGVGSLFDATDVVITNTQETPPPTTPEPQSFLLIIGGVMALGFFKRAGFLSAR